MTASTVARLKITLDDVRPAVQRRVEVPVKIRLDRLHLVFQAALGWTNSHLYEIRAGDVGWGMVDPDWGDGPLDATQTRLLDVIEDVGVKTLKYLYDFGDGWEHTVKIERIVDAVPGLPYPVLLDATGRCPPEDVGGPWGYSELLEVLADPEHERHDELTEWVGDPFDPLTCDVDQLAKSVDALHENGRASHRRRERPAELRSSPDAYASCGTSRRKRGCCRCGPRHRGRRRRARTCTTRAGGGWRRRWRGR